MQKYKVEDVFGISIRPVLSYISRPTVDGLFQRGLASDRHLVVYGASKQGKTALVKKYLDYDANIVVHCEPRHKCETIYTTIARKAGVRFEGVRVTEQRTLTEHTEGGAAGVSVPLVANGGVSSSRTNADENTVNHADSAPAYNLSLAQDLGELLKANHNTKKIILENFHYLKQDVQNELAYGLRNFQEMGIQFIVLGVWKEVNRLVQFNGDLLERISEIPVEPWSKEDLKKAIETGEPYLNIRLSDDIVQAIIDSSYDSIGVVQELVKSTCENGGVFETCESLFHIENIEFFERAVGAKTGSYSTRYQNSLESMASGQKQLKAREGEELPLYLPYYFVKAILASSVEDLIGGISRAALEAKIREFHHREEVRASDTSNLFYNIIDLQVNKKITPPIFSYDRTTQKLHIVDSTFFFFMRYANLRAIADALPVPEALRAEPYPRQEPLW